MLKLKGITKQYRQGNLKVDALKGINLEFRKSEFVAVLGVSGCGKTTLLNIIGGLDKYTEGDLFIDGVSTQLYKDSDWDSYRNNSIGFVFQSYNLIPHQTVLANVELALTLAGVSKEERRERAKEVLNMVGLGDQLKKKPNQMSGGQMQRVAIARALVNDPDILLADEPTGALDSETSIQVMEILKEISKDRLVIMVTHNPELAEKYANRTIRLSDGLVISDSNEYISELDSSKGSISNKKTSMSFFTALHLSLSNLLTKKGRTIMTAFAGSIGIIGIALILSLANGVNSYIENVEEDMLSIYPLTIMNQGMDFTSMMMPIQDQKEDDKKEKDKKNTKKTDKINEIPMLTRMFSNVGKNDLASLKKYFDNQSNPIWKNVNSIQYSYNITPQIYSADTSNGINKVNPNDSFEPMGFSSTDTSSSILNMSMNTDAFYELADNTDLFNEQYEVVKGKWPKEHNELLLVLTSSGKIPDLLTYSLGFRDKKNLDKMIEQFVNGDDVSTSDDPLTLTYDDILSKKIKLVNNCDYFKYNSDFKVWEDLSDNESFMKKLIKKGEDLKFVGIVKPIDDASTNALSPGIYYPSTLTRHLMEEAAESEIVKKQLDNPKLNIFTGKTFKDEAKAGGIENDLDLSSFFSIDGSKMTAAFSIDQSKLNMNLDQELDFSNIDSDLLGETDISSAVDMEKTADLIDEIMMDYMAYAATHPDSSIEEYLNRSDVQTKIEDGMSDVTDEQALETELAKALTPIIESYVSDIMSNMITQLQNAMSIDENKFMEAFNFKMTEEDMQAFMVSLMGTGKSSLSNNLVKLGYAKESEPYSINIYPKNFETKQNVLDIMDKYNKRMEKEGQDDKVIVYTDMVGTLMSSLNEVVNLISYVLIAFVSISLVVSSIMIGIITYISVLERKKEIGILRSLGAAKKDISRVFNAETLIIGFSAGILAIILSLIIAKIGSSIVYNIIDVANIAVLPPKAGIILVIISMFLTFIAGLIPSGAAARRDPVEALRSE